ncbi:ankyrin repeat-containing protein [Martensiomyces pterosporus]|nr:ankyrin repeat-containing protein [Martensiomyces pterosporus]
MSPPQLSTLQREDFDEVLESEVFIDVNKLRKYARHGIPDQIRGEVWKYLLGVEKSDRSSEFTQRRARYDSYQEIDKENVEVSKRVRGEVNRYLLRTRKDDLLDPHTVPAVFEAVICAYINCNNHVEYSPALVQICAPFVITMKTDYDVYSGFERLVNILYEPSLDNNINKRVAQFLSYFRTLMPELYNYFEEEDVDVSEWASSWLRYLLAKELPIQSALQLWDVYFALPDFVSFHPFVCLAILKHLKDSLEDLEQSEIRSMLLRLPKMNIGQIVNQANNIRSEIQARYGAIGSGRG